MHRILNAKGFDVVLTTRHRGPSHEGTIKNSLWRSVSETHYGVSYAEIVVDVSRFVKMCRLWEAWVGDTQTCGEHCGHQGERHHKSHYHIEYLPFHLALFKAAVLVRVRPILGTRLNGAHHHDQEKNNTNNDTKCPQCCIHDADN